jgi:hypothetical protein
VTTLNPKPSPEPQQLQHRFCPHLCRSSRHCCYRCPPYIACPRLFAAFNCSAAAGTCSQAKKTIDHRLLPSIPSHNINECAIFNLSSRYYSACAAAALSRPSARGALAVGAAQPRSNSAHTAGCRNKRRLASRRALVPGRVRGCAWATRQVRANGTHACERVAKEAVSSNFFT